MIDWEMVIAVSAAITLVGACFLFVLRAILKPLEQLIQSNTEAVKQVVEKLDMHEERIQYVEKHVAILQDRSCR